MTDFKDFAKHLGQHFEEQIKRKEEENENRIRDLAEYYCKKLEVLATGQGQKDNQLNRILENSQDLIEENDKVNDLKDDMLPSNTDRSQIQRFSIFSLGKREGEVTQRTSLAR